MWTRSSFCARDEPMCVEVERCNAGEVHVRDSKDPGQYLHIANDDWRAFIAGAKAGDFDEV